MADISSAWKWNIGCKTQLVIKSKVFTLAIEGQLLRVTERSRRFVSHISGLYMVAQLIKALEACSRERKDFYPVY